MDISTELTAQISATFRLSRNAWNARDSLSNMSSDEIKVFIRTHAKEFDDTVDLIKADKRNFNNDEAFFNTPIGARILVFKIKCEMVDDVSDLGQEFIDHNMPNIEKAAEKMYNVYKEDGELDDLYRSAENDWYREFLYEMVERPNDD